MQLWRVCPVTDSVRLPLFPRLLTPICSLARRYKRVSLTLQFSTNPLLILRMHVAGGWSHPSRWFSTCFPGLAMPPHDCLPWGCRRADSGRSGNGSYLKQPICHRLGDMGWTAYVAGAGNLSIVGNGPMKLVALRRAISTPRREHAYSSWARGLGLQSTGSLSGTPCQGRDNASYVSIPEEGSAQGTRDTLRQ